MNIKDFWNNKNIEKGKLLIIGIITGVILCFLARDSANQDVYPIRENNAGYSFIDPLLFYNVPDDVGQYEPLESQVQGIIKGQASDLTTSVYYRDLNSGRWFGIQENQKYTPASLLKVVIMMAYFKEAELTPSVLSQRITFSPAVQSLMQTVPDEQNTTLVLNGSYLASNLIDKMITNSDNGATYALLSKLDDSNLAQVFQDLGLQNPQVTGRDYTISAQDYASFFRVLYDATYLNLTMSERALALLSKTDFKDGIVAGVAKPIPVSHKYGEAVSISGNQESTVDLHDCGIVYYPKHHYLICIMTRATGSDQVSLLAQDTVAIKNISQAVYETVAGSR